MEGGAALLEMVVNRTFAGSKKELISSLQKRNKIGKNVIEAFKKVKREQFVLEQYLEHSYDDVALPIVGRQTISQPSTIAYMLDLLNVKPGNKVLEIGSGSGYNAALIAEIVGSKGMVYSVEFLDDLYKFAKKNITNAKIKNVKVIKGDGSKGYHKEAPYDRIIITAACPEIPGVLLEQLESDGAIVAPVGSLEYQKMVRLKKKDGMLERFESDSEYIFVPLKGENGFN